MAARLIALLIVASAPAAIAQQPSDPPSALSSRLPPPKSVDLRRAAAAGIRHIDGDHLRLFTDLPTSDAVDELPRAFDAAVEQWAKYFGVSSDTADEWRVQGFLVSDRERFKSLGLLPRDNPIFTNGYSHAAEFWLMEQPSDYYRRHLLLHEGTHAFMYTHLGAAGPGWYMEGLAELLGTHDWDGRQLKLGVVPSDKRQTPMWGRIKLVRDAVAEGRAPPIEAILHFDNRRALDNQQYAWAWALSALFDQHPTYQARFRSLQDEVASRRFNERFRELFDIDAVELNAEWQAYLAALDYGYDVEEMAMVHRPAEPVGERPRSAQIAARGGWQSTGFLLVAGQGYAISAEGRFRIADDGQPWVSEPGGVTIDYFEGRPLGMLLGALRPEKREAADSRSGVKQTEGTFSKPLAIGLGKTITPLQDAVLYVRVNDAPGRLKDNGGEIVIHARQTLSESAGRDGD